MLNIFKSKSSSFLGLDVGTDSIKLVELEGVGGRPRLVTYGMVEVDSTVARNNDTPDNKAEQEKIAGALKSLLEKSGASATDAVAALPNFAVFSSVISLPKLGEKQLAEAVQWEAKKFVPMPIENVVLDWKILHETEKKVDEDGEEETPPEGEKTSEPKAEEPEKSLDPKAQKKTIEQKGNLAKCKTVVSVLLTAAPRHLVERYVSIFKLSGLNLLSLETESFALSRSLVGNEDSVILIADVGSLTTDITVVKKGVPVFSRSINAGGKTVTKAIADSMDIDPARAEQFKQDVGMNTGGGAAQSKGVAKIIEQSFTTVINEMKYTLETQQRGGQTVEKILLTGGSAFLPSLDQYISNVLGVKVLIGNPWARISYPKDLVQSLEKVAPRMGVAIGLAMREIE
jgi:type IV pilus assembly protein PilM